MHRHSAFTIVEMLVSMALIMFIMVILSEAFIAGLESFRTLKAIGDMETKLRTVVSVVRRDLEAQHFVAGANKPPTDSNGHPLRLNNFTPGSNPGNLGGFFAVMGSYQTGGPIDISGSLTAGSNQIKLVSNPPSSLQPGMPLYLTGAPGTPPPPDEYVSTDPNWTAGTNPIILTSKITNSNFTKIKWPVPIAPEGYDGDSVPVFGGKTANGFVLHFTVNLGDKPLTNANVKMQRRESYFTGALNAQLSNVLTPATSWNLPLIRSPIQALQDTSNPPNLLGTTALQNLTQYTGQAPFFDAQNYYTQFAEIAYFVRETGQFAGDGTTPLHNLYRRQVAVLNTATPTGGASDYTGMNGTATPYPTPAFGTLPNPSVGAQIPLIPSGTTPSPFVAYYDFSWIPVAVQPTPSAPSVYYAHFNSMQDLVNPYNRSLSYGIWNSATSGYGTVGPLYTRWTQAFGKANAADVAGDKGQFMATITDHADPNNPAALNGLQGTDLLLTDVISMTVRIKRIYGNNYMDTDWFFEDYDSARAMLFTSYYQLQALEITLRIWDRTTQKARQLTIVQNM